MYPGSSVRVDVPKTRAMTRPASVVGALVVAGAALGCGGGGNGGVGPAAQAAKDWALALSDATGLPTALWDERLSSAAVNRFLIEQADLSRAKRAAAVDRAAAAWLLQGALDALRSGA